VHRSQGQTCERAHVYEDGGGRELAYVAMSRAKEQTHVYVAADDLGQAREDLARSWQNERRWQWAIDTGTPEVGVEPATLRREALVVEREILRAALPVDVSAELTQARHERDGAAANLERLRTDRGRTSGGELGRASAELANESQLRFANEWGAERKDVSRKSRRTHRESAKEHAGRERAIEPKVAELVRVEERRLTEELERAERKMAPIVEKDVERERWFETHPEVPGRLREIDSEISGIDREVDRERQAVVRDLYPELELERQRTQERSRSYDYSNDVGLDDDFGLGL
jgi:hypothetical protein